ncbi:Uncharacterised protein [Yersinia similis]|nr:Uncharacterised protein [Yersinia similis]
MLEGGMRVYLERTPQYFPYRKMTKMSQRNVA